MPRSDYLELLDEAEAAEPRGEVWDLEAEAERLNINLRELPMDEKGWDRAVNVAYRKCALKGHPDKVPPGKRSQAEANFKKMNESHKLLLRVGKAVRFEAESGEAEVAIAAAKRAEVEAKEMEKIKLSKRLASVMSLNGVTGGFSMGNGSVPDAETKRRTKGDLQTQMAELLQRCGAEFEKRARRKRRMKILRRILGVGLGVAFLWFVRKNAPPDMDDAREELREIAQGLRAAIRFMGAELASAVGRPGDSEEMADDLEEAFLEGRMSVNDSGGLEVLIPDDEVPGMYYKLNMSSREDGSMSVWTEGADGERVEVELGDLEFDDEPAPGVFGLPAERMNEKEGRGVVNVVEQDVSDKERKKKDRKRHGQEKKGRDWEWKKG